MYNIHPSKEVKKSSFLGIEKFYRMQKNLQGQTNEGLSLNNIPIRENIYNAHINFSNFYKVNDKLLVN